MVIVMMFVVTMTGKGDNPNINMYFCFDVDTQKEFE